MRLIIRARWFAVALCTGNCQPGLRITAARVRDGGSPFHLMDEHVFNTCTRPWRLTKKGEAGLDAGIVEKTSDRDAPPQFVPSVPLDKLRDDSFQCDAVQRISGNICVRSVQDWKTSR